MDPLVFIVSLSIIIFIHELGHFFTAKKVGMYVEEFGLGLPPRLLAKKIKDVVYSINLLPIGGFVKIFGESEEDTKQLSSKDPDYEIKQKKAFYNQPSWKQAVVLLAGVTMNFIFGWAIISLVFVRGVSVPAEEVRVVEIAKGSPAQKAGLLTDDIIARVEDKKVVSSDELVNAIDKSLDKEVLLSIKRDNKELSIKIIPRKKPPKGQGAMGVVISDSIEKKYSLFEAPWLGLKESVRISKLFYKEIFKGLTRIFQGEKPGIEVAGPVGIYSTYKQAHGLFEKALLTGLISLNLALINIVPFPALDGGHVLIVIFEALRGKPVSAKTKQKLNIAGLAILLTFLLFITVKDILKIVGI